MIMYYMPLLLLNDIYNDMYTEETEMICNTTRCELPLEDVSSDFNKPTCPPTALQTNIHTDYEPIMVTNV